MDRGSEVDGAECPEAQCRVRVTPSLRPVLDRHFTGVQGHQGRQVRDLERIELRG